MAPRKDATAPTPSAAQTQQDASSEGIEDFELSKTLITQLAKSALPNDVKLEDDTVTALVKGSTVFINYLTATAQEIAASRAHKTISGADVLKALEMLEFGELVNTFQNELEVFRQGNKADKGKGKAVVDVKGKGKEKASPSASVKSTSVQPVATGTAEANNTPDLPTEGEVTKNINGGSALDVEMRDVEMRDVSESEPAPNVVKSVTLPIE